jgi:hypothetical protein
MFLRERLKALKDGWEELHQMWENRQQLLSQSLNLQMFNRDAKQAEVLLSQQEHVLSKDETPVSTFEFIFIGFIRVSKEVSFIDGKNRKSFQKVLPVSFASHCLLYKLHVCCNDSMSSLMNRVFYFLFFFCIGFS